MKAGLKTAKGSVASFFKPYVAYAGEKNSGKATGSKDPEKQNKSLYQQMLLAMEQTQRIREYNNKVMEEYRNSPQVTEKLHLALDMAGFVFDAADPANGLLYLSEWDFKNAGISFAATIPIVGSLGTVKRVSKAAGKLSDAEKLKNATKTPEGFGGAKGNIANKFNVNDIPNMTKKEILESIPQNWTYTEHNGFIHIRDANEKMRMRIDPPDSTTKYPHVHVYDSKGNLLDRNGNVVPKKSPEGHIPYKEE